MKFGLVQTRRIINFDRNAALFGWNLKIKTKESSEKCNKNYTYKCFYMRDV